MLFFVLVLHVILTASHITEIEAGGKPGNRIIGGSEAKPNELPYQLAFEWIGNGVVCGAALIHPQYALTAAHCTDGLSASELLIHGGEHTLEKSEGHEQKRKVVKIFQHEQYNAGTTNKDKPTVANDVAILKLDSPMNINQYVKVIPMANAGYKATGLGMVSGWGVTSLGGNQSRKLKKVSLPIVNNQDCAKAYSNPQLKPFAITDKMLCAGKGGEDSCQGDSGGPLVAFAQGKYLLIGVVSAGFECANGKYPGFYSSVAAYRSWIDPKLK